MRKKHFFKQTSKFVIPLTLGGGLLLASACGVFLIKGRQRLLDLVQHTSQKTTEVYSALLDLTPRPDVSREYILQTLSVLCYDSVSQVQKPGQFATESSDIAIRTRGFDYAYPSCP